MKWEEKTRHDQCFIWKFET